MTFKRFISVALAVLLLLSALPQLTDASYAETTSAGRVGCPYSPDGKHSWGAWEIDIPGTCIAQERLVRKCKKCGALDYWIRDYGDHDWGEGIVTKQPTATEDGERTYTCKNDPTHIRTEIIPATGGDEKPSLSITLWVEDWDTGEKKTELEDNEDYSIRGYVTNTGNVDLELYDNYRYNFRGTGHTFHATMVDRYLLKPGETVNGWGGWAFLDDFSRAGTYYVVPGTETDTLAGTVNPSCVVPCYRPGTDEVIYTATASITFGVLKPEEEAKPGLKIEWLYDKILHNGSWSDTTEPGVLAQEDRAFAYYTITNTGTALLKVVSYVTYGSGDEKTWGIGSLPPGQSSSDEWGSNPITCYMTPGTGTEQLLGTTTVNIYAVGYAPGTFKNIDNPGKELCRTETITRTWRIGKEKDWEIPEGSRLSAALKLKPGYDSSDPAGYQLGEDYAAVLYVKNTGLVDLDGYTVEDPWDGSTFSGGPIAVGEEQSFQRASGTVAEKDVSDGSIKLPMITVSWEDPDSEETRTAFAGPLNLTVISKTGLLVKKSVANNPANGSYFTAGEIIKWKLTVTNNSKEPIKNVTVTDKGQNVGSFSEIAPGETKTCTVPDHTVTEYDEAVGYVTNTATATGTDVKDVTRTYPSNTAKAWTAQPEDETEEKYKEKEKDDEDPGKKHIDLDKLKTGDGDEDKKTGGGDKDKKTGDEDEDKKTGGAGNYCSLTLNALGDTEARYTLHTCSEHIEAARNAEALGLASDWAGAAELWRGEIDALYELLFGVSDEEGLEILTADMEALYAYADTVQALFGDEAAANLLRIRCAELCCMIHTAPDDLPSSLAGMWAMSDRAETYEVSSREIGALAGSDSEVIDHYAADAAEALANTKALLNASRSYNWDEAFHQSMSYWQGALDGRVNEIYMAAAKEQKKLIATWRKSLDDLRKADRNFYEIIYEENPAATEELLMDLYIDAALLADSIR